MSLKKGSFTGKSRIISDRYPPAQKQEVLDDDIQMIDQSMSINQSRTFQKQPSQKIILSSFNQKDSKEFQQNLPNFVQSRPFYTSSNSNQIIRLNASALKQAVKVSAYQDQQKIATNQFKGYDRKSSNQSGEINQQSHQNLNQILSPPIRFPDKPNQTFPDFKKRLQRQVQYIKVKNIAQNYQQNVSHIRSMAKDLISSLNQDDPNHFKEIQAIRQKVKAYLEVGEDKLNLQNITKKQIQIIKVEILNAKNLQKHQKLAQLRSYLQQMGSSLSYCGKHKEAREYLKEQKNILQRQFKRSFQVIQGSDKSFLSRVKSLIYNNDNQISAEDRHRKIKQTIPIGIGILVNSRCIITCAHNLLNKDEKTLTIQKAIDFVSKFQKIENQLKKDHTFLNVAGALQKAKLFSMIALTDPDSSYSKEAQTFWRSAQKQLEKTLLLNPLHQKATEIYSVLTQIKENEIKNGLKTASGLFQTFQQKSTENLDPDLPFKKGYIFNRKSYQDKVQECQKGYRNCLNLMEQNSSKEIFRILKKRNEFGQFLFEVNKYNQSLNQVEKVLENKVTSKHTTGSQALLTKGKVNYARGNLKQAFESLNKSYGILKDSLLKEKDQDEYKEILLKSQIYRQIELMRVKIYNSQLRHDLAIKTLDFLAQIYDITEKQQIYYLADIYEEKGNTLGLQYPSNIEQCIQQLREAIKIRSKIDQNCFENALTYFSITKYLLSKDQGSKDRLNEAKKQFKKGLQIFKHFPLNHSNSWIPYLILAKISQREYQIEEGVQNTSPRSEDLIKKARQIVAFRYGEDHINTIKIRYEEAMMCLNNKDQLQKLKTLRDYLNQLKILIVKVESKSEQSDNVEKEHQETRNLFINDEKQLILQMIQKFFDQRGYRSQMKKNPQVIPQISPDKKSQQRNSSVAVKQLDFQSEKSLGEQIDQNQKQQNNLSFEKPTKIQVIGLSGGSFPSETLLNDCNSEQHIGPDTVSISDFDEQDSN